MNVNFHQAGIISIILLFILSGCDKQEPVASFSVENAIIEQGDQVTFRDQSINNPVSWSWTFAGGDPATSSDQHPTVTYDVAGQYSVSLSVSNEDGSDAVQRDNYITVNLPAPVAAFTSNKTTVEAGGTVSYTDQSTNSPSSWAWVFEGGTPSTSTLQNPTVQYLAGGTYSVGLMVSNEAGSDYIQKDDLITVTQTGTNLTFFNTTYTDIDIEINSDQRIIPSGGSVIYSGLTGNSVDYYASTSVETTGGTQVGYLLVWDNTINLDQPNITRTLLVDNSFYFLYIQNRGSESFNQLDVGIMDVLNGYTADRSEYISIPNDNVDYPIGYYTSYTATSFNWIQIYAYTPFWSVYWAQGSQFTLPDTSNQSIHLFNTLKKSSSVSDWKVSGDPETFLYQDYAIKPEDQ